MTADGFDRGERGSLGGTCRPDYRPWAVVRPAIDARVGRYGYFDGRAILTQDLSFSKRNAILRKARRMDSNVALRQSKRRGAAWRGGTGL